MARAKRIISYEFPYHITARCINKEWFGIPMPVVWEIFGNQLYFISNSFDARIHAFVLMSNHFHLMMSTPGEPVNVIMRHLMTESSRSITFESGRINQTFGGPYFASLITKDIHYQHCYKYVLRNPIEAGLCQTAEDYSYSSLKGLLGFTKCEFPMSADELLFPNIEKTLNWVNTPYKDSATKEAIRSALRKATFQFARCSTTRKPHVLETTPS